MPYFSAKIWKLPYEPPHQDDSMIFLNLFLSFKAASLYHTSGLIWKLSCVIGKLKKSLVCLEHLPSFLLLRWKLCIQILAHPPCPLLRIGMNQDNPWSAVWKPTKNSHMVLWGIIWIIFNNILMEMSNLRLAFIINWGVVTRDIDCFS